MDYKTRYYRCDTCDEEQPFYGLYYMRNVKPPVCCNKGMELEYEYHQTDQKQMAADTRERRREDELRVALKNEKEGLVSYSTSTFR